MAHKLSADEIESHVERLDGWTLVDGKLHRELRFTDFAEAFGFMTRVADYAEEVQHHPEWRNVWNRVVIDLSTHDVGGLSDKDVAFAEKVNELLG